MSRILKFPIALGMAQDIAMPRGSQLLTVQLQREQPCLWAICPDEEPTVNRVINIHGAGHYLSSDSGDYIATFQQGPFVWHVFDGGEA